MSGRYEIWGPATGSSHIVIERNQHGQIVFRSTTDFGETNCGFTDEQVLKIRDALNCLLGLN